MKILPDGFEALGMSLKDTLTLAYADAPFFNHFDDFKGDPSWVTSERYDLQAKLAPADIAQWRKLDQNIMTAPVVLQQMLRAVLEERCKLRIHGVPTKIDGYVLRIGAKSSALAEDATLPTDGPHMQMPDGAWAVFATQNGERTYTFYNTSMSILATYLTFTSKHPVEDRTGLRGRYKFVLRRLQSSPGDEDSVPPVPYDLRALGLKVDREEVPSMVWVVDSIERPSPN